MRTGDWTSNKGNGTDVGQWLKGEEGEKGQGCRQLQPETTIPVMQKSLEKVGVSREKRKKGGTRRGLISEHR